MLVIIQLIRQLDGIVAQLNVPFFVHFCRSYGLYQVSETHTTVDYEEAQHGDACSSLIAPTVILKSHEKLGFRNTQLNAVVIHGTNRKSTNTNIMIF